MLAVEAVGAGPGGDGQAVLGVAVRAEDFLGCLNVQFFQWHKFRYCHFDVVAVLPAVKRRPWPVIFHRGEAYGADV